MTTPLALSIVSGILIGTSLIPFWPWALFFCLSPLLYVWQTASPRKVFICTTLSFFLGSLISLFWFSHLLQNFAKLPPWASLLATIGIALFYHIPLALGGWAYAKWFPKKNILVACAFLALIWHITPFIFPWNFSIAWLYGGLQGFQFADLIGAKGLHALTLFINGASLWAFLNFKRKNIKPLIGLLAFLVCFHISGWWYGKKKALGKQVLNTIITQANIHNLESLYNEVGQAYHQVSLNKYIKLTERALAPGSTDLIVWPETAFSLFYNPQFFQSWQGQNLKTFVSKTQSQFVTGIFERNPDNTLSNSALFLNRQGETLGDLVKKKHLLAFGEYLPGETWFPFLRSLLPMVGDFTPGTKPVVKILDTTKVGMQICYEGVFPFFTQNLRKQGAQILINLTNDSWYGPWAEPWQHLYLVAFRSIESGVPLIRSTNSGLSTVILPNGNFMSTSKLNSEWVHLYKVPFKANPKLSFYHHIGIYLTLPLLFVMLIMGLIYEKYRT